MLEREASICVLLDGEQYARSLEALSRSDFVALFSRWTATAPRRYYQITTTFNARTCDKETTRYRVESDDPIDAMRYSNFEYPDNTIIDRKKTLSGTRTVSVLPCSTGDCDEIKFVVPLEIVTKVSWETCVWRQTSDAEPLLDLAEREIISLFNEYDGSGRPEKCWRRLCVSSFYRDAYGKLFTLRLSCGSSSKYRGMDRARCAGVDVYSVDIELEEKNNGDDQRPHFIDAASAKIWRQTCMKILRDFCEWGNVDVVSAFRSNFPKTIGLQDKFPILIGTFNRTIQSTPPSDIVLNDKCHIRVFAAPKWDGIKAVALWHNTEMVVVVGDSILGRREFVHSPFVRPVFVQLEIHRDDQRLHDARSARFVVTEILAVWQSPADNLIAAFRDFKFGPGEGNYNNSISSTRYDSDLRDYATFVDADSSIHIINIVNLNRSVFGRHLFTTHVNVSPPNEGGAPFEKFKRYDDVQNCIALALEAHTVRATKDLVLPTDGAVALCVVYLPDNSTSTQRCFKLKTEHTIELALDKKFWDDASEPTRFFVSREQTVYDVVHDSRLDELLRRLRERKAVCVANRFKHCLDVDMSLTDIFEFKVCFAGESCRLIAVNERPDKLVPDGDSKIADIVTYARYQFCSRPHETL